MFGSVLSDEASHTLAVLGISGAVKDGYLECEMPRMLSSLSWNEVKEFFISESMRLGKLYLEQ